MARPPTRLIFISVALGALALTILTAQSGVDSRLSYDVAREITLSGTVSAVLTRPGPGMIMGSHLLLKTVSGIVDASLGRWGLGGNGALAVEAGQRLEVTGIMRTLKGKEVFLTRTVKASGKIHTIRNAYGIPLSPQARLRAAERGESQ
jgi:hypothetical protein